jgi:hypothetical protein
MDTVNIEQELVLYRLRRRRSNAGRERARARAGEAVARRIGLDQGSEQAGVDIFDAHAGTRDAGKRDLHQVVIGLAVGRADRGVGKARCLRQFADVAHREDDGAGAVANQRIDAADRVGGARRGRHGNAGQGAAALIMAPGIIAADADLDKVARRDRPSRSDEPLSLLGKSRVRDRPRSGQRRRRINEIRAAAESTGRIDIDPCDLDGAYGFDQVSVSA